MGGPEKETWEGEEGERGGHEEADEDAVEEDGTGEGPTDAIVFDTKGGEFGLVVLIHSEL